MKIKPYLFTFFLIISLTPVHYAVATGIEPINIGPLLTTKWGQGGKYSQYTPHKRRLGCWSVAFAQILNYHKIQPSGKVQYTGADYKINEDLGSYQFNWNSRSRIVEAPRYCYYTAAAIGKDFDKDGGYLGNSDYRRNGIEKHFHCETESYTPHGPEGAAVRKKAIVSELKHKRPLLLYIEGPPPLGHALVIDGARNTQGKFEVHLNFGWYGNDDGWYELEKTITPSDEIIFDSPDRWLCAIRPKKIYNIAPGMNIRVGPRVDPIVDPLMRRHLSN